MGGIFMRFYNSLRFKLTMVLICISIIPLLCLSAFQLNQFNSVVNNNIMEHELSIAYESVNNISTWIDSKESQLTEIYKAHPEFVNMDTNAINLILKNINESDSEIETLNSVGKDGKVNDTITINDRDYFNRAKETKAIAIID